MVEKEKVDYVLSVEADGQESSKVEDVKGKFQFLHFDSHNQVHRRLQNRHVQLIAIGGAIGTALFISIGGGLIKGGPLGLLLAYLFWTFIMILITTAVGEMVCYMPIASPFVTLSGVCVDEALEFTFGWNFYLMQSLYIPFEIVAVNGMIHFWRDDYSPAITLCVQIFLYTAINLFAVKFFGETEFWLAIGKFILVIGLMLFTFITMVGGNPQHDVYGFRNWKATGGPIAEYLNTGANGRFQGFLGALIQGAFTIVGPEYMSMVAGEVANPRKTMPKAFRTVLIRLCGFYIGSALCVGVLVAYNDPFFVASHSSSSDAAASPYVVAMKNLGISVLPDIVNVVIITSAFSAGNSYVYCSSRALYGLAKQGFAPKLFGACNSQGVPVIGIGIAVCFALLSLLQLGSGSAVVLGYITSICTGSQVLNYVYMGFTYIGFYKACNAQGIDRKSFSYRSWWQPYSVYFSLVFLIGMVAILGYPNFLPGNFVTLDFIFNYIMVFVNFLLFVFWKLLKKTKLKKPTEVDLVSGLHEIEEHEYQYYAALKEPKGKQKMLQRAVDFIF